MNDHEAARPTGFGVGHLLLALMGGAAAGAAAVFLTAPRSGQETRRRLHSAADETRDAVGRVPVALRKATEAARDAFNEALTEENHA
jgi:gas vesicle protein